MVASWRNHFVTRPFEVSPSGYGAAKKGCAARCKFRVVRLADSGGTAGGSEVHSEVADSLIRTADAHCSLLAGMP